MKNCDVLIIGAGATGLMAAHSLTGAGKSVIVLEARGRLGGRIHTLQNESFFKHAELGAEFIHGELPVTLELLKTAGIAVNKAEGEMWHYANGAFKAEDDSMPYWDEFIVRLNELEEDMSIEAFLQQAFSHDKYAELRDGVRQFAAGYDTADPELASAFALRKEWEHEDDNTQHRVQGGYTAMVNFLAEACKNRGGEIFLNSPVTDIYHEKGAVRVVTAGGETYYGHQIIVAMPLGLLKLAEGQGAVRFHPPLPQHTAAFNDIGFGAIIKILLEFDEPFWEAADMPRPVGKSPESMGFLISDQAVPTWWAQYPKPSTLLCGWLGGPAAAELINATSDELLDLALASLSKIFGSDAAMLRDHLIASNCVNWTADPYTRGSYAYDMVASPQARVLLSQPLNNTLFFAGEYLYDGAAMGTVEAALTSGRQVGERIISLS